MAASRITTPDGITTTLDPTTGLTIKGRDIAEIEQERRHLACAHTHERAIQRWNDDGGRGPREAA